MSDVVQPAVGPTPRPAVAGAGWGQVAVVLGFFAIVTWAQFIIRLDYGPDEPSHLEYIHVLAVEHRLPTSRDTHQAQHPPPYYLAMAAIWKLVGVQQRPESLNRGLEAVHHMTPRAIFGRRALRLCSSLLSVGTLLVILRTLSLLGVPPGLRACLLLFVAANPVFQYLSSVVNNEPAAYLYGACLCLLLVQRLQGGQTSLAQAAWIGAALGGAVWVKQTLLFVAPVAVWVLWVSGPAAQRLPRLGLAGLLAVVVPLPWLLHNLHLSGQLFPCYVAPHDQAKVQAFVQRHPERVLVWLGELLMGSVLPDWSVSFISPAIGQAISWLFYLVLLLSFVVGLYDRQDRLGRRLRAMGAAAIAAMLAGVLWFCYATDWRAQNQGRYLFSAAGWVECLLVGSLRWWQRQVLPRLPARVRELGSADLTRTLLVLTVVVADLVWWYLAGQYYLYLEGSPGPG